MLWGTRTRTEPVIGGEQVTRHCAACGQTTTFYEQKVRSTLNVYFVDLFAHSAKHVMSCGACQATYVTDELAAKSVEDSQKGTLVGTVGDAVGKARQALDDGTLREKVDQAGGAVSGALEQGGAMFRQWLKKGK